MHVYGTQGLERMEVSASSVSQGSRERVMEAVVAVLASALASASVSVADRNHVHDARNAVSRTTRSAIIQVARRIARFKRILFSLPSSYHA